jgi:hypothetical protein
MKKNELVVLKRINRYFSNDRPILCPERYHRFDAYNDSYIIEIKYRNKKYDDYVIEFDKYAYNKLYSELHNKKFLYVVGVEDETYVFNISNLDRSRYNYKWEMRSMPKQTEFDKNYKINKYVGYLELWAGKKLVDNNKDI